MDMEHAFHDSMTPKDRVDDSFDAPFLEAGEPESGCGFPLAMVYAPKQEFRQLYTPDKALEVGTLFEELNFPWEADGR